MVTRKLRVEFAAQYLDGRVWMPNQPRWTGSVTRLQYDVASYNKIDFGLNQRTKRRIVMRVVSDPEEIGVEWVSGKAFNMEATIDRMRKRVKEVLLNERQGQ